MRSSTALQLASKGNGPQQSPALLRQLAPVKEPTLFLATPRAAIRFWEFFTANIRNKNTRIAYLRAAGRFSEWCQQIGLELGTIQPIHVSAYIENLLKEFSAPTVKQHLAAIRMLFDWLVVGQVIPTNPAHAVRGPKYSIKRGKTPVLSEEQARQLLLSIETDTLMGLRDRALLAVMLYTFARVSSVIGMAMNDYELEGEDPVVRLHEKGGKFHTVPLAPRAEKLLEEYIQAADLRTTPKSPLFRSAANKNGTALTNKPLSRFDVHAMIKRRLKNASIRTKASCHSLRATGITEYLRKGGRLETAQQIANHESSRTTGLYDRRDDRIPVEEMSRIGI